MQTNHRSWVPDQVWFGRVRFTPGFLLLAALLLYQSTSAFLTSFLLAAALHELGHILTAHLLGIPIRTLSMTAFGCVLSLTDRALIPDWKLLFIAAAGPMLNLTLAFLSLYLFDYPLFGAENLLLALFNLLPVFPLDGAVILVSALSAKMLPEQAERCVCMLALLLVIATAATALSLQGAARPRVFLFALWLAVSLVQKIRGCTCHFSRFQLK